MPTQTRDYLLKVCPKCKEQQKTLWGEGYKETGKGRRRWRAHDLLADPRCRQALLDFLTTTGVGGIVPPAEEEADAGSKVSEWELWECGEREEERRVEAEALFLPTPPFMTSAGRSRGRAGGGCFVLSFSCVYFLGAQ